LPNADSKDLASLQQYCQQTAEDLAETNDAARHPEQS
jgi:hypothetical protein